MDLRLWCFASKVAARIQDVPRTVDSNGSETNVFNESHFDQLWKQGIITSSSSATARILLDAPRTDDTDGADTNAFNESHFDRLREQGIIQWQSHSTLR